MNQMTTPENMAIQKKTHRALERFNLAREILTRKPSKNSTHIYTLEPRLTQTTKAICSVDLYRLLQEAKNKKDQLVIDFLLLAYCYYFIGSILGRRTSLCRLDATERSRYWKVTEYAYCYFLYCAKLVNLLLFHHYFFAVRNMSPFVNASADEVENAYGSRTHCGYYYC